MKYLYTFLAMLICAISFSQTSIQGKVMDKDFGEPIIYGNVAVYQDGNLIIATDTDFDGNYVIEKIEPGTYDVEATYTGYTTQQITEVIVQANVTNILDINLSSDIIHCGTIVSKKKRRFPKLRLGKKKKKTKQKEKNKNQ